MQLSPSFLYKHIRLFALLSIVVTSMSFTGKPGDSVVIIVNLKNPIGNLTVAQAKDIYLRKESKRWKALNSNIIPLDTRGDSDTKNMFLAKVLQMSKIEMYRYFSSREYQNQEQPPVRVSSEDDIIKFVQENSGAIGYVMSSVADGKPNIKVICTVE
ncbi:MAG: substrate-binding domain-containing protein [Chryseolinea sp.]